jgi:hypothetical protein
MTSEKLLLLRRSPSKTSVNPYFYHHFRALTWAQINESTLRKVIEWCTYHKADPPATNDDDNDVRKKTTDIDEWDQKFMQVDQEMLFEIILVSLH